MLREYYHCDVRLAYRKLVKRLDHSRTLVKRIMELYKRYLLYFCVHSVYGAVTLEKDSRGDSEIYSFESQEDVASNEIVMPLISNGSIPEALNQNDLTRILLQIVRTIFRVSTRLGLAEQGWRISSDFIAGLLAILFGPNVNILIPVVTSIGNVILRWLT